MIIGQYVLITEMLKKNAIKIVEDKSATIYKGWRPLVQLVVVQ